MFQHDSAPVHKLKKPIPTLTAPQAYSIITTDYVSDGQVVTTFDHLI